MEFMNLFGQYQDPRQAIEILKQYTGEFATVELLTKTVTAIKECTTPKDLDVKLGYLFMSRGMCSSGCRKSCGVVPGNEDVDNHKYYSRGLRILEGN